MRGGRRERDVLRVRLKALPGVAKTFDDAFTSCPSFA